MRRNPWLGLMNATLAGHGHMRLCACVACQSEGLIVRHHLSSRRIRRLGIMVRIGMTLTLCLSVSTLGLCLGLSGLCSILLMLSQLSVIARVTNRQNPVSTGQPVSTYWLYEAASG